MKPLKHFLHIELTSKYIFLKEENMSLKFLKKFSQPYSFKGLQMHQVQFF